MANFIAIPLKTTSEIDLVKLLKHEFTTNEPACNEEELIKLNNLRMESTCETLDKHENSLDVMTRYFDQLNLLDSKYPNVKFQGIFFEWKNAFDKSKRSFFEKRTSSSSLSLSTLEFEKVCILFNIGAMQSQVACSHISDTKNDESLKLAAKYFQMASGTFAHLKTLVLSYAIKELTPDLAIDTISALQALMLAQAQESFFFKATADNMKDGSIAKVASRAEELYAETLKLMLNESVSRLWEKDWVYIVAGKQSGFLALSEYYQSLVCKFKKDVGEEIARLQRTLDIIRIAEEKRILTPAFKQYIPKVKQNYNEAKKDNDFIYHAMIPDIKSLPPIGKAALAIPILPEEKLNSKSEDSGHNHHRIEDLNSSSDNKLENVSAQENIRQILVEDSDAIDVVKYIGKEKQAPINDSNAIGRVKYIEKEKQAPVNDSDAIELAKHIGRDKKVKKSRSMFLECGLAAGFAIIGVLWFGLIKLAIGIAVCIIGFFMASKDKFVSLPDTISDLSPKQKQNLANRVQQILTDLDITDTTTLSERKAGDINLQIKIAHELVTFFTHEMQMDVT